MALGQMGALTGNTALSRKKRLAQINATAPQLFARKQAEFERRRAEEELDISKKGLEIEAAGLEQQKLFNEKNLQLQSRTNRSNQRAAQKAMGMEAGKLGLNMATGPGTSGGVAGFGSNLFGTGAGLGLGSLGSGLAGFGAANLFGGDNKLKNLAIGAGAGALTNLFTGGGIGPMGGLLDAGIGGLFGGLGSLF
jgi:hypothetical protein